jgi:hypothetical protein
MDMNDRGPDELERRAREWFDASVAGIDAVDSSRLQRARQRALEIAARSRPSTHGARWVPAGAIAAGLLAAALLLRAPTGDGPPLPEPSATGTAETIEALDLLAAGEDLDLATEADLDFYEWVAAAAEAPAGDGVG